MASPTTAADQASVLLEIEDKTHVLPGRASNNSSAPAGYPAIAPRNNSITNTSQTASTSAHPAPVPIAPATESRTDGTPINPFLSDRNTSGKRKRTGGGGSSGEAPPPGSDEWHKQRKESHKEVERRRREVINQGIDRLAELVPSAEKNKGRILAQAVEYIHRLKATEAKNIEKWTIEKLLADQAISELTSQNEQLKAENRRLREKLGESPVEEEEELQDHSATFHSDVDVSAMAAAAAAAVASAQGHAKAEDDTDDAEEEDGMEMDEDDEDDGEGTSADVEAMQVAAKAAASGKPSKKRSKKHSKSSKKKNRDSKH
ncbi:basic helix-loop-helix protein [Linderina pennispora]|nr:basic helix-loop-helix protein [Linderina pennispora]